MSDKLIIYELNELPKKLLNYYINIKPNSNLSKLKKNGFYLDTFTTDSGELHPWTTWATFYRGVDNRSHKITSLNQEREYEDIYPPIWKRLLQKNKTIGIFGSLQSYPPIIHEGVKFYLPDTFSPSHDAYPKNLETFQKFNLKIVGNNSGEIKSIRRIEIKYFFDCILNSNIRINSILSLIFHLILETINPKFKRRRSLLQPKLSFDIYLRYLRKHKPDFTTFFTNHLAGMMHYYWLDIFPMDFKNPYRNPHIFNKNSVLQALDIADRQIGLLMNFAKSNSYEFWVASSMGQAGIEREKSQRLFVRDFIKILKNLNLNINSYKILPSMYPDINIESDKEKNLKVLIDKFLEIRLRDSKKSIFKMRYKSSPKKVNLIFNSPLSREDFLIYQNMQFRINEFGLGYGIIQQGTGYHIPEGVLLMQGKISKNIFKKNTNFDSKNIFQNILRFFELKNKINNDLD